MILNLDFASKSILSCFFFFFLIIDLYFLIPAVIVQTCNPIAELVIPIEIPTKETKAETETHTVIVEIKISKRSIYFRLYNYFYASYSLIYFDLFLQLNNFLFHLSVSVSILDLCFL